ncbi:MAG TPA: hypothetical protein VN258_15420 [Mobilitalea sp.]|nr:hypothetical protein [Mobilitalea sp.]
MDIKMNPNTVNQFLKGTDIFKEGDLVFYVAMIIKGRVLMRHEGAKVIMGSGTFLGINDLYSGRYQSTYTAYDDLLIYVYPVKRVEELDTVLSANKDYHGFMVASFYKMIYELDQIYQGIIKNSSELYQFLKDSAQKFQALATRSGCKVRQPERILNLTPIDGDLELISDKVNYYKECNNLPIDAVKSFYSYGNAITLYQLEDQVNVVNQQIEDMKELSREYIALAECLVDDSDTCLFRLIAEMAIKLDASSGFSNELMDIMDNVIEEVNKAELFTEKLLDRELKVDRKKMEEVYHLLLTGNQGKVENPEAFLKYSLEDSKRAMEELEESFRYILNYAGITGDRAEQMETAMLDFIRLRDKSSSDDSARIIRRRLAENHYEIYKSVFLRAYQENNAPRLIDLFLKYGYADERLLTKDQLLSLYFLTEETPKQGLCNVYDIKTWLTLIYEGKKEPSKNEFDQEYTEMVGSLKKQGRITDKEATEMLTNPVKKLEYEIDNMFRYNNRTTNGQISSFVPVLHQDLWSNGIERLLVTSAKINEAVAGIMKVDYTVFDREVIYANKEKNIVKEYIVKRVYPDIILFPNIGSNGIMWQEIAGKRRDSAGRFLLPIFSETNLTIVLIRIFGRFRWELCRTIEGAAWNDISHKSLTSEYSDYLQFYRKNKELSEEKKEKIKQQIQKGRNNNREIFVIDYEQWVHYESMGALKLNKLVREIMATYCPFSKDLRDKVKLQPLFEEAMARYNREKLKKIREVEGRHRLLMRDQIEITPELLETLNYYRDL